MQVIAGPRFADPAPHPSKCHVLGQGGGDVVDFTRDTVEHLLAADEFFWLDRYRPDIADFDILRDVFEFHPLAVQDSEHFDQRAKIDDYEDFVFFVVYGASPDGNRLVEVHCFYSAGFLVTVHREDCPAFAELRRRYDQRHEPAAEPSRLVYRVMDGLISSFFPILCERCQIAKAVNATVIPLDEAPQGYQAFDKGASTKYVLDLHGMLGDKQRIGA